MRRTAVEVTPPPRTTAPDGRARCARLPRRRLRAAGRSGNNWVSTALTSARRPSKHPTQIVEISRFLLRLGGQGSVDVSTVDTETSPGLFPSAPPSPLGPPACPGVPARASVSEVRRQHRRSPARGVHPNRKAAIPPIIAASAKLRAIRLPHYIQSQPEAIRV